KQETKTEKQNASSGTVPENALPFAENKKPSSTSRLSTLDLTKRQGERTNKRQDQILPLKPKKSQQEKGLAMEDVAPPSSDQIDIVMRSLRAALPIQQYYPAAINN